MIKISKNYCEFCGRPTDQKKKKLASILDYFFPCNNCKKVWCVDCMGGIIGKGSQTAYKRGKKGKVQCPECKKNIPMIRLPTGLPFSQEKPGLSASMHQKTQQEMGQSQAQNITINVPAQGNIPQEETKFCSHCGKNIKKDAVFCEFCGGEQ